MYVIKRTDKDYGGFSIIHETLELATEEAERLSKKHVDETPKFTIYELKRVNVISAKITITNKKF